MNQVSEDDTAGFVEMSRLAVAVTTLPVDDSDSPLAQAIRRRQRERDHPAQVTAGHDSVI